jgi:ATP-dependent exoDNAse (exonuclease V) beta subunit
MPFAPVSPASEPAISPLVRGSVFHRCLEEYTKQGSYDPGRIITEHPDIARLDSDQKDRFFADIQTILNTVLANATYAWIFERRPDSYTELPFLYRKGNNLVSGIIDRLVIAEGKGFVIDYKAISIENKDALIAWTDHYRPQIRIYCEAVKEMFKLSSVEGYLLYLDSSLLDLTTKV